MSYKSLMNQLTSSNRILILCHHNADPDALGAAYGLLRLISERLPSAQVTVATSEGSSRISKQILKHLNMSIASSPPIEEVDTIILVDTNTFSQLGELESTVAASKSLILIDHHAKNEETTKRAVISIINEEASSTSEIVYDLLAEANLELDKEIALALFLGIAYDTRHFAIARSNSFKIVAKLLDTGLLVEDAYPLLTKPPEASEKIARLKGAQRLQLVDIGGWIIVKSRVGSFQSSVARGLVSLGADVAIVGGESKGRIRISVRSDRRFFDETGVHLGRDITGHLGGSLEGKGGGHSTAAGVNGAGNLDKAFEACLRLFEQALSKSGGV
ncbi:DHH family phosphoesterase [Candidatus Bathyarchaeota archaeon]|nr:DHH family phosphoesterase [Candidatus Bathyarchaeota archaeon]